MAVSAISAVRTSLANVKFEAMKLYRVFDLSGRLITQYDAPASAKVGDECMRTDYNYDGTSSRIIAMKESVSTWSLGWDF